MNQETGLSRVYEDYFEGRMQLYPLEATIIGDNRYNDRLPNDISKAFREELEIFFLSFLGKLNSYNRDELNREERISYDVLKWECTVNLERLKFHENLIPIDQFWSLPLTISQFAAGKGPIPFNTVMDYNNWLARLDQFVIWCDTAIQNMTIGLEEGYVLPVELSEKIIPQLKALSKGPVADHLYYRPVKMIPDQFSEEEKRQIEENYRRMIDNRIIPTFMKLVKFFINRYLPASRTTTGIDAIPNGKDYYQYLVKFYTTTSMAPDEVFELGLQEVARIRGEMEQVKVQVGFENTLEEFFDYVRTHPDLMPYKSPEEVIAGFEAIHKRIEPTLKNLFDLKPKTPFEVRRTEKFRELSASAEYNPGSLDMDRPGIFYVPVPNVLKYNVFTDESLFLHEAIPGHHYQISIQMENDTLPDFRRYIWYGAYGEGWALYCESLGKDLGLYEDPYQYFGMLSAEIHRAIRLVVDVGMHEKGWTRKQAIEYSLQNEAEPEASIISEIERYMAIPGQALSYKVGQVKITELRDRAKQAFGDQFDIREFHNQILEDGCLPLAVLEAKIDDWILEKQ